MNAKEIISTTFDNIDYKGFDESDIVTALYSIPESDRSIFENTSELLAFQLVEGGNNEWNTYYGPFLIRADQTCFPSKEMITTEVLDYWEKRVDEVQNPMLKARYSGLLVDFKQQCNGNIRTIHIQAILDLIKGNYPKYAINGINKLQRAMRLAILSKNKGTIAEVKNAISEYETKVAKDYDAGIWGRIFLLMFENIKHFSEQEKTEYIDRLEGRLTTLTSKNIQGEGNDRFDPFVIEQAVDLLAQYYNKINDRTNLQRILNTLYDSYNKATIQFSAMQKQMYWDKLYRIFDNYQFKEKAKKILAELQNSSSDVIDEMQKIEMPFEIPQEQFEEFIKEMTSGSKKEVFGKFIAHFIPNKEYQKEQLLKISKDTPLLSLCPTQLFDYKGRPNSVVGNIENDLEGKLVLHISKSLNINALFIRAVIKENINNGFFSKENIMHFIQDCPLIEIDRKAIISKGVDAYLNEDYLTMLHLLIPQIENAVRNIVEKSGRSSLKRQKNNNGFQLMTFDDLLIDEAVLNIGADFAYYLRILFTNQKGWNLRNLICHGISQTSLFNSMTADRVFHALLCIGAIKYQ
ncbi:MAG: DUF4209 domain-containing protein [Prevotella sp.]|jgi:hypothetical protein|nr:MAG: DUF4209 domain-containing protein [Prevotella sp.]